LSFAVNYEVGDFNISKKEINLKILRSRQGLRDNNEIEMSFRQMSRCFFLLVFILFLINSTSYSVELERVEVRLYSAFERMHATRNLEYKMAVNDSIRNMFSDILQHKASFDYSFDTLKTVGKILSPDKLFRIINWNVVHPDGSNSYYGYIQYYLKTKDTIVVTELIDFSERMEDPEQQMLDASQWYGALYYDIVPAKEKSRTHYLLLGWDGGDLFVNRKVIDVLSFSSSGVPKFGKNVFVFGKQRKKRVVFEFSYMATMKLFYDKEIDMVVFEHMVPINSSLINQRSAYGSDLTFDGLEYEKGKWVLRENLNVKNKKKDLNKRKKDISYTF